MKSALSLSHDKKQPITTWSQIYHCHMTRNNQSQHEVSFIIVTWQETTNHNIVSFIIVTWQETTNHIMKSNLSLSHDKKQPITTWSQLYHCHMKKQLVITIWYNADIFIMVICCECQDVKTTLKASRSFCMALSTSFCSSCSCLSLSCKAETKFFPLTVDFVFKKKGGYCHNC